LKSIRDGARRSRVAFLVSTIISLGMLIAGWNAYFSWVHEIAIEQKHAKQLAREAVGPAVGLPGVVAFSGRSDGALDEPGQLLKQLMSDWVASTTINTSFLGIRVGISDASLLGAISLCVTSVWLFLSIRRNNHNIGLLLLDTRRESYSTRRMILQDVVSGLVFIHIVLVGVPVRSLNSGPRPPKSGFRKQTHWLRRTGRRLVLLLIDWSSMFLYFLPAVAVFTLVGFDLYSLYIESPFRASPGRLIDALSPLQLRTVYQWSASASVFGAFAGLLCYSTVRFERATKMVLQQYKKGIRQSTIVAPVACTIVELASVGKVLDPNTVLVRATEDGGPDLEILANRNGKVTEALAQKGQRVLARQALLSFDRDPPHKVPLQIRAPVTGKVTYAAGLGRAIARGELLATVASRGVEDVMIKAPCAGAVVRIVARDQSLVRAGVLLLEFR
jgi:hypothetical protein